MDEQINGMVETIQQLEKENAELKLRLGAFRKSLLAAGKLALSARLVTSATAKNISQRIDKMEEDLNVYDNEILSASNVC